MTTSRDRFNWIDKTLPGVPEGEPIEDCSAALFRDPAPNRAGVTRSEVELPAPCDPHSTLALCNRFHQRARAEGRTPPVTPLYSMNPVTRLTGPGQTMITGIGTPANHFDDHPG